jgi:hypothetical protein
VVLPHGTAGVRGAQHANNTHLDDHKQHRCGGGYGASSYSIGLGLHTAFWLPAGLQSNDDYYNYNVKYNPDADNDLHKYKDDHDDYQL